MYTSFTHIFLVDTLQYSGNFERQLVAWMTGQVGECGVGQEEADLTIPRLSDDLGSWFQTFVVSVPNKHGCCRPAAIFPTPGWFNSGMGQHWREGTDEAVVRENWEKAHRAKHEKTLAQKRAIQAKQPDKHADWERDIAWQMRFHQERLKQGPGHYGAYQSVGVYFDQEPPSDVIAWLKERAESYSTRPNRREWDNPITITGYRLIEITAREMPL